MPPIRFFTSRSSSSDQKLQRIILNYIACPTHGELLETALGQVFDKSVGRLLDA